MHTEATGSDAVPVALVPLLTHVGVVTYPLLKIGSSRHNSKWLESTVPGPAWISTWLASYKLVSY